MPKTNNLINFVELGCDVLAFGESRGKKECQKKKQNPRTELTFTILLNSTEFEQVFKLPCGDQKTNQLMVENTRDHAVCHINSFQGILNSSDVTGNGSVQTVICDLSATAQL